MKVLIVLTSHDKLGDTGKPTGFWLEEFAAPYYVFKDAGAEIVQIRERHHKDKKTGDEEKFLQY